VARTGWGENAVVAEMKVNVYNFANHQHLDAGAFQLYYRGALAIDSGLYQGSAGGYGSPHDKNYHWRTIAHNSLLVHDPKEVFGRDWGNDGGQRLPNNRREPGTLEILLDPKNGYQTGEVLAQGCGPDPRIPDYTYLTGDITRAYSSKVRQVVRSFVFLNLKNPAVPAALVVFDRVVATDPAFRKYWLLHTLEEPQVEGNTASVEREKGCLSLTALLPPAENQELSKVGGPGKEFWVFGKNYPTGPTQKDWADRSYEMGAWRLELAPRRPSEGDFFLVVMQVSDRGSNARLPVTLVEEGDQVGCKVGEKKVLFSRGTGRVTGVLGRPVR
jgi:heparin/heparan-sulfate lyase